MVWTVACCMLVSIILFFINEIVVLYFARTRRSGILLTSLTDKPYINQLPPAIKVMDVLLTTSCLMTLVLYGLLLYDKLSASLTLPTLDIIDIGVVILLYILYPSRKVSHLITAEGLYNNNQVMTLDAVDHVSFTLDSSVRKMSLVRFHSRGKRIEGYISNRDVDNLQQLLRPHMISFEELVYDGNWRER